MGMRLAARLHLMQEVDLRPGPIGHLAIFFWSLAMVMLVPVDRLVGTAVLCLVAAAIFYPHAFRRILRLRFLVMLALLPWGLGLVLVGPWLGHASWHAYRGSVLWQDDDEAAADRGEQVSTD